MSITRQHCLAGSVARLRLRTHLDDVVVAQQLHDLLHVCRLHGSACTMADSGKLAVAAAELQTHSTQLPGPASSCKLGWLQHPCAPHGRLAVCFGSLLQSCLQAGPQRGSLPMRKERFCWMRKHAVAPSRAPIVIDPAASKTGLPVR